MNIQIYISLFLDQKESAYNQAKKMRVKLKDFCSDITKLENKIDRYDSAPVKSVEKNELGNKQVDSQLLEHKRQIETAR